MKKIICSVLVIVIFVIFLVNNYNDDYVNRVVNYNGNDLMVSIDGVNSNNLPSDGRYYLTSYKCGSKSTVVSWNAENHNLSISNGSSEGGVACNLSFESKPKLSSMSSGSYVKYNGNNGCNGNSCDGVNVNYVNDNDMGYCGNKNNKFINSGWRLFYVNDDTVYLVSAGALECVNRSSSSSNVLLYINELNSRALGYCNKKFAYNGECNNYSARSITEDDFDNYLDMKIGDCLNNSSNVFCGYNNDLIDIGSYYWFGSVYDSADNKLFVWNPYNRYVSTDSYVKSYGLRVVVRLASSVYVVSGNGTYDDPYVISI